MENKKNGDVLRNYAFDATQAKMLLVLAIVLTVVVGAVIIMKGCKTTIQKKEIVTQGALNFKTIGQVNVAEINTTVKVEYGYNPQTSIFGKEITMPDWGPGSRKVSLNGPITYLIGYDSLGKMFPDGMKFTAIERDDSLFVTATTLFVLPQMTLYSYKGYTKASQSLLAEKIDEKEFYAYFDSLSRVSCDKVIRENEVFFMGSYTNMIADMASQILVKEHPNKVVVLDVKVGSMGWKTGQPVPTGEMPRLDKVEGSRMIPIHKDLIPQVNF